MEITCPECSVVQELEHPPTGNDRKLVSCGVPDCEAPFVVVSGRAERPTDAEVTAYKANVILARAVQSAEVLAQDLVESQQGNADAEAERLRVTKLAADMAAQAEALLTMFEEIDPEGAAKMRAEMELQRLNPKKRDPNKPITIEELMGED